MKRRESARAIYCDNKCGPIFGNYDIFVFDHCIGENKMLIVNNGNYGYQCHPQYKSSLYANSNAFLDYEVYTHN